MRHWINLCESASYPLYHGTSLFRACLMVANDHMRGDNSGDIDNDHVPGDPAFKEVGVSLTRSKGIAANFASQTSMDSAYDLDDFRGIKMADDSAHTAILVFDAADIHAHFTVATDGFSQAQRDEEEERVLGQLTNLRQHLRHVECLSSDLDRLERVLQQAIEHQTGGEDWVALRDAKEALAGLALLRKYT